MSEKNKQRLTLSLICLSTIPFIFFVAKPTSWELTSANMVGLSAYISSVTGFVGLGLLIWMYILGTRSVTGLYFRDLTWTLKIHNWLGKYGVLFVFLHPFFSAYFFGANWLTYWLKPLIGTELEQHITFGRIAFILLLVIWVASALVRGRIKYRPWKYIHYLAYVILPLSLLHTKELGTSLSNNWASSYFYSFILLFCVFSILRLRHVFGFGKLQYKIVSNTRLTPNIYLLTLQGSGYNLNVWKGQYVYLQRGIFSEEHPFSVVMSNISKDQIIIAYKVFGKFTEKLANVKPGNYLLLDGPYGVFTEEIDFDPEKPVVFIAGGIGITPFVGHIYNRKTKGLSTILFYASQKRQNAALSTELKQVLGDNYIEVLSGVNEPATQNSERGHLNYEILTKYLENDVLGSSYYICGPSKMMKDIRKSLLNAGVNRNDIHLEEFSL
ncbi:ferric reductase-like transmembrane domain-containing protein [Candidatus Saccharibacteria bacterium]|nr:ferric reductase-like transmembrane domain-containing protein [Candidatus Saccharibacteria bacterium]